MNSTLQDLLFCPDFTVAANRKSGPVSILRNINYVSAIYIFDIDGSESCWAKGCSWTRERFYLYWFFNLNDARGSEFKSWFKLKFFSWYIISKPIHHHQQIVNAKAYSCVQIFFYQSPSSNLWSCIISEIPLFHVNVLPHLLHSGVYSNISLGSPSSIIVHVHTNLAFTVNMIYNFNFDFLSVI